MKKLILSIFTCVAALAVNAQTVTLSDMNYTPGTAGSFKFNIEGCTNIYSSIQAWIMVPEGLNIATSKNISKGAAITEDNENVTCKLQATTQAAIDANADAKAAGITIPAGYKAFLMLVTDTDNYPFDLEGSSHLTTIKYLASDIEDAVAIAKWVVLAGDGVPKKVINETITGINNLKGDDAANGAVAYDLTGRKTTAYAKGIKVINGKKVIK